MQTRHRVLIAWLALAWPLGLWAEPLPTMSMKVSEYDVLLNGNYKLQRETTVSPLVIADPKSPTGYTINEGEDLDHRGDPMFLVMVAGSTNWDLKPVRDELAPKLKALGDVCGPSTVIKAMTTPAPEALGRGGEGAMHFEMIIVKGCTEAGVYSERVNSPRKGLDCFVDRGASDFSSVIDACPHKSVMSSCFFAQDFDRFLNQCIADVRAYKQQRGLLPARR